MMMIMVIIIVIIERLRAFRRTNQREGYTVMMTMMMMASMSYCVRHHPHDASVVNEHDLIPKMIRPFIGMSAGVLSSLGMAKTKY